MKDFWLSCGHHLLDRDSGGGLVVTDDFLKAYLARPELVPPPEAGPVERTVHAALLAEPRRAIGAEELAAIEDDDARENWAIMLAFRERLLAAPTLEAAYLRLIREGVRDTPPLFVNQLVHVILRNALDGCDDARVLRAAEMLFRPQRLTLHEGSLLAADEEVVAGSTTESASPLVSMFGLPAEAHVHVLNDEAAPGYFERSDNHDLALDLTAGRRGLSALAEVLSRWIAHLLGVAVEIEALSQLRDVPLTWYVGLDAHGTRIGDALWSGEAIDEAALNRVVGLFRLTFRDPAQALEKVGGEPVYLILAMTPEMSLRIKPQNLVVGLPVRHFEVVS